MKISPKIKLNFVFWFITVPVIPFVLVLLLFSLIVSPIPGIRNNVLNKVESLITKFAVWRNNLPIVKKLYDKVHLFDYIKNSN